MDNTYCSCGCGTLVMVDGRGVMPLADRPVYKCGELAYIELFVAGHDVNPIAEPAPINVLTDKPILVRYLTPDGTGYGVTCYTGLAITNSVLRANPADRVLIRVQRTYGEQFERGR